MGFGRGNLDDATMQALAQNGLRLEHPTHGYEGAVPTCEVTALTPAQLADTDWVLVCVKATATRSVASSLAAALSSLPAGEGPLVLSLQNGVDNEAVLAATLGAERVLGGLTRRIGAHIVNPGHVRATGPCETILGHWPNTDRASSRPGVMASITAVCTSI